MGVEFRVPGTITMIPQAGSPKKRFGELSFEEIKALKPELTPEEANAPEAKYFNEGLNVPEEFSRIINGPPMDPKYAFEPWDYAKHMNTDGYNEVENGYCVLPSGITYSAVMLKQPGRTNEKMDFYNKNFGLTGSLGYKAWTPGYHYFHYTNGAVESFGYGLLNMRTFSDERDYCNGTDIRGLGVDLENVRKNDPRCIWIGGNDWELFPVLEDRISDKPIYIMICNYLRETDEGRELRIRLFGGVGIRGGKFERTDLPEGITALEAARLHMAHLMYEYGHEITLVNDFWNDNHPKK